MGRADKATLRLTIGLGIAVAVAYGLALPLPFAVCVLAVLVLSKPGPPLPLAKGAVVALLFFVLLTAGVLMVPVLESYAAGGLAITAAVLYLLFYSGLRGGNSLTVLPVMAFALMPVVGVADQTLVGALSKTLSIGIIVGVVV